MAGKQTSTAFLAFSETWVRRWSFPPRVHFGTPALLGRGWGRQRPDGPDVRPVVLMR